MKVSPVPPATMINPWSFFLITKWFFFRVWRINHSIRREFLYAFQKQIWFMIYQSTHKIMMRLLIKRQLRKTSFWRQKSSLESRWKNM
jgi:hypothetical protein